MRIAYLANVRIPSERAHSTQIIHMCQAFAGCGHELDLYANTRVQGTEKTIAEQYKISLNFRLIRIPHGVFNPNIKITFYLSELFFSISFLFLKKKNYEIIYSRNEWVIWFLSFFFKNTKLVWESHEAKLNLPARRILKSKIRVVVISEGIRKEYALYGKDMVVAHDGIDESFFEKLENKKNVRERLGIPDQCRVVMYIGGLDSWKGVDTFCKAAEYNPENLYVIIGGSNSEIGNLKKLHKKVLFLGQRPYAELSYNQQAADVLVVPNTARVKLSSTYTSPLKIFAHMTSTIPLVVSDIPSIKVVMSNDLVSFFTPDDPHSLSQTVTRVLNNYQAYKNNASILRDYSKRFLWSSRAEKILDYVLIPE